MQRPAFRWIPLAASAAAAAVLVLAASSGEAEPPGSATPRSPAPPSPEPPGPGELERYRILGESTADGCGGRIVLAARIITLHRARGTLFADVVNRTYRGRLSRDRVSASGRFDSESACPSGVEERWDLRRSGRDELRGTLASSWRLAPRCEPCTITFRIRAVRIR